MKRSYWIAILLGTLAAVALGLWVAGVFDRPQVQRIDNVSRPQRLVFQTSDKSPSGVTLRVRGHIDGTAIITTVEDQWPPQKLGGDVDWAVYKDWFQSTCAFDYAPTGVTAGHLTLELTFH